MVPSCMASKIWLAGTGRTFFNSGSFLRTSLTWFVNASFSESRIVWMIASDCLSIISFIKGMNKIAIKYFTLIFHSYDPLINFDPVGWFKSNYQSKLSPRAIGLVVWFLFWVQEVPGSIPGLPLFLDIPFRHVCLSKDWYFLRIKTSNCIFLWW